MSAIRLVRQSLVLSSLMLAFCLTAHGQYWTQYDQGTPPQHATGVSPLGSYISTEIGTVNLSNGALNIHLPLATVGGRGFSVPISLNYSSKVWSVTKDTTPGLITGEVLAAYASYGGNGALLGIYNGLDLAGWSTGGVPIMRRQFVGIGHCESGNGYNYGLTKLTAAMPDGSEIELRDDSYDGAARLIGYCSLYNDVPRSLRWHATDGSGAIFIYDNSNAGTLITGDGTRYRFDSIFTPATSVTDRNGNQISINRSVDSNNPAHVTLDYMDQLGRSTKVEQGVPDPANGAVTLALLVTVKGYQESTHYYKVKTDTIGNLIRSDLNYNHLPIYVGEANNFGRCYTETGGQPPPANYIFPDSYCLPQQRIDNQSQVSEVDLPDGRSLQFKYNLYGEVAEVVLPTGGKLQYDYAPSGSLPSGNTLSYESGAQINGVSDTDRAVTQRRTYSDGNLEATWTYTFGPPNCTSYPCVDVKAYAGNPSTGTLLLNQRHLFLAPSRYLSQEEYSVTGTGYSIWRTGLEWKTETRDSYDNVISAVQRDWLQRASVSWPADPGTYDNGEQPANDNRLSQARHYLDNGSVAKTDTVYDDFNYPRANNVNEVKEYDLDQSLKRRTTTTYVTGSYQTNDSIHLVSLPLVQTVYDGNNNQMAQTSNEYDVYTHDGNHEYMQDYGSVIGHDGNYGSGFISRGNLTAMGHWLNTNNFVLYSYLRYDTLGNPVGSKDANGNLTTLSYTDNFGDGHDPETGSFTPTNPTYSLPTLLTSPPLQSGQQTAHSQYDFSTGLLTGFKDRNNVVTQTLYCRPCDQGNFFADPFDRPTQIRAAYNTAAEAHSAIYYAPTTTPFGITLINNDVLTAKDQTNLDDHTLRSWTRTDDFGRTVQSWTRDPQGDDEVVTIYDALSRVKQVSNPFRAGETVYYTSTNYDLAGRVTSVTTPDNAVVGTYYNGNQVLVKDQAGKERMSQTNALGQLTDVWEIVPSNPQDPGWVSVGFTNHSEVVAGYLTHYTYDPLDDLRTVEQRAGSSGTLQTRTFVYDSLKRLTSATNPESGTITYAYDDNGNLTQKTDPRFVPNSQTTHVTTTYDYDALNRIKTRSYNDGTPPNYTDRTPTVTYTYDSSASCTLNCKGRLASLSSSVSTYNYSGYDAMGRASGGSETISGQPSQTYLIGYTYDLAGHVKTINYPSSGHAVTYNYDSAGRLADKDAQNLAFTGNLGSGGAARNYSTGITYSPFGGLTQEKFGTTTSVYNQLAYNRRGQLAEILVGSGTSGLASVDRGKIVNWFSPSCGGAGCNTTDNNGNLMRQDHSIQDSSGNVTASFTQKYEYDNLNRLQRVYDGNPNSPVWKQRYSYDRWGNRTIAENDNTGVSAWTFGVEPNTNRLTVPANSSGMMTYDNAGNLTTDTFSTDAVRAYDADNRMTSEKTSGEVFKGRYTYDGDGRRVKRNDGSTETWQVYGVGGELIAEYAQNGSPSTPQKEYGYRNGQLLITADAAQQATSTPLRTNFALAANGGVATASSTTTTSDGQGYFEAKSANNGDRAGVGINDIYNNNSFWRDGTPNALPDWLEVDFSGNKTINEIDVYTFQDDYLNPVEPTEATTFSLYGITDFDVQYLNGSTWTTVPNVGHITGNNKIWRKLTFSELTTSKIKVIVNNAPAGRSRIVELEAWGLGSLPSRTNVALTANGGVASASSTSADGTGNFEAKSAINRDRAGVGINDIYNNNSFWRDGTPNALPDWLEVDFSGNKTINEIDVYTFQDDYLNPVEPTEATTFSLYGITDFDVQYSDANSAWTALPNNVGHVTGNNKIWRKFTFPPITTNKIRVVVNNALYGRSRIVELEAWQEGGSGGGPQNVTWTNVVNASAAGNNLTQTGGGLWEAGALSVQTINSGDGYMEFTVNSNSSNTMCGLGHGDPNTSYYNIDFAFYLASGALKVVENGGNFTYLGSYATGDVLRVAVEGGVVKYQRKVGTSYTTLYTSLVPPPYPLSVDTSLNNVGSQITNVVISSSGNSSAQIHWLVTDQLGTPRIIFDQSGSLATMSRHDYLPFGEELFAGTGGRTTAQGYPAPNTTGLDGARQKFTQKERDIETGLDWFDSRYYASSQGRFTSPDSYFGRAVSPQTLNLYSYVRNNPLKYVDPTGHQDEEPQKKRGKKGENDPDICDDCVVVINSVPANSPPPPVPQPTPVPSSSSEPFVRFMTRQELQEERRAYYRHSQADGIAYDISHNPALLFLMGLGIKTPEEPPITNEILEETGIILEESSVAAQTRSAPAFGDILMPGGAPIGEAGTSSKIRVLQGGLPEAQAMFDKLTIGGSSVTNSTYKGSLVSLPNGGTVGLRTIMTRSPGSAATIDVNVRGIPITKIKFNPK